MILITLLLVILSGILFGERNTIQTKPNISWFGTEKIKLKYPKISKWWISNNWYYENKYIQWLMRYPLSFCKDGIHLMEASSLTLLFTAVSINVDFINVYLQIVILYVVFGTGFNASYHDGDII